MLKLTYACVLLAVMTGCALPVGSEHNAARCREQARCSEGFTCYRGYCIRDDSTGSEGERHDAGDASFVQLEPWTDAELAFDGAQVMTLPAPADGGKGTLPIPVDAGPPPPPRAAGSDAGQDSVGTPDASIRDAGIAEPPACDPKECCDKGKRPRSDKCVEKASQQNCKKCSDESDGGACRSGNCRGES